jgi:eukaryotic-like serine/threonine-protein kinase
MKTVNPRWARIQELFNQAADMTLAERSGFLDRECSDDPVLRKELDDLLAADAGPPSDLQSGIKASLLTRSISSAMDLTSRDRRKELIGTVIGAYRLTAVLGHGGAGTVYLGERADRQYSAQVAVKVVENALLIPTLRDCWTPVKPAADSPTWSWSTCTANPSTAIATAANWT